MAPAVSDIGLVLSLIATVYFGWPWLIDFARHASVEKCLIKLRDFRFRISAMRVTEWLDPNGARMEFGNEYFAEKVTSIDKDLENLWKEDRQRRDALQEASAKHGNPLPSLGLVPEAPEITAAREAVFETAKKSTAAREDRKRYADYLTRDLEEKLASRELMAKGLPLLLGTAARERLIPAEEWRILKLDCAEKSAEAHGLKYVGVVIGKPL